MSPAPIIITLTLLGTAPGDSSLPQIAVVQTWDDLVQVEPQTLTKEVRVRVGISRKSCPIYGGVTLYCLADGLNTTQQHWRHQIGPVPIGVKRDSFSETFWSLLEPTCPLTGGHKCGESPALFMYPLVVTDPSDATSHPHFKSFKETLGRNIDPPMQAELAIRVFRPDRSLAQLPVDPETLGWRSIEISVKARPPWLRLNVPGKQWPVLPAASPNWDPLLPIPLPKNLAQRLPSLFPESPSGELVLTYVAGKLILKSRFSLAEDPSHGLLIRYWRGQKLDLSKTEFLRAEEVLRLSEHEYTIHVAPAPGVNAGTTIGVQLFYCELGWRPADPNSHADAISDHLNPVFPVVSNRVDVTIEEGKR